MKYKMNYNECLTNLVCSVEKYFNVDYAHNTLPVVDEILERKQPENVIIILYDGMGDNTMMRHLDKDGLFIRNRRCAITSVFPPTTTAATTTVQSGLNPSEHGWLGWNTYIPKMDKVMTMFTEREKGHSEVNEEFQQLLKTTYHYTPVTQKINEKGEYKGFEVNPFGETGYKSLDEMYQQILDICKEKGRKYLYVYNNEPDHTMHEFGPDSEQAIELMKLREQKTEELIDQLDNAVVIVVADHGHVLVDNIYLEDYPELYDCLERTTSVEPRAVALKVKEGTKEKFREVFERELGQYFGLYDKEEVIESQLFGDGKVHPDFAESIGDFMAIAEESHKTLMVKQDYPMISQHAGCTDDEVYVPLIIVEK